MKTLLMAMMALVATNAFADFGDMELLMAEKGKGQQQGQEKGQQGHAHQKGQHVAKGKPHIRKHIRRHRGCRIVLQQERGPMIVNSLAVSCGQLQGMIAARGQALIEYTPGAYYRFVAHEGYCLQGQEARQSVIQTADTTECYVGLVCE